MKTKLYDQHGEHSEWISKLAFYNDELRIMQHQLEEIAGKNTAKEVLAEVEHFQNQIMVQAKNIESIGRSVSADEKALERNIKANPVAADHRTANDHVAERAMMEGFENNFNKLRQEFKAFLSKRM